MSNLAKYEQLYGIDPTYCPATYDDEPSELVWHSGDPDDAQIDRVTAQPPVNFMERIPIPVIIGLLGFVFLCGLIVIVAAGSQV